MYDKKNKKTKFAEKKFFSTLSVGLKPLQAVWSTVIPIV
jgi:hypothetical protein